MSNLHALLGHKRILPAVHSGSATAVLHCVIGQEVCGPAARPSTLVCRLYKLSNVILSNDYSSKSGLQLFLGKCDMICGSDLSRRPLPRLIVGPFPFIQNSSSTVQVELSAGRLTVTAQTRSLDCTYRVGYDCLLTFLNTFLRFFISCTINLRAHHVCLGGSQGACQAS